MGYRALVDAIDRYAESKQLHKPVVGGPASASVSDGEQLGNEAGEKGVCDGHYTLMCKHKGGNCSCLGGFCLFDD